MVSKNKEFRKQRPQTIFFSIFLGVLALGLIGFLFISDFKISEKKTEYLKQVRDLEEQVRKLKEKNSQLKSGVLDAQTETYWEEKIREQGYQKPGEEQVVVLPPKESGEQKPKTEKNFWQNLLGIFNPR